MDPNKDSDELAEFVRTQSIWVTKNDSFEQVLSSRSNKSGNDEVFVSIDDPSTPGPDATPESDDSSTSRFVKFYKSIGWNDQKTLEKVKNFLAGPPDKPERNDQGHHVIQIDVPSEDYFSDSSSSLSDMFETRLLHDEVEDKMTTPVKLKHLMIYKTIQFMDYRKFSRRFNGIRKPVSNKKALFICGFCAVLALVPFVTFSKEGNYKLISVRFRDGVMPYVSSVAFLIGAFFLAKIQLGLPLKLPVILSYLFMFSTLITFIVLRSIFSIDRFVWQLLISYAVVQIILIVLTRAFIYFVPVLALNGQFFPCTEHFHLLKRTLVNKKLNVTMSRYNDYTTIWDTKSCGVFTCVYRSLCRAGIAIKEKFTKADPDKKKEYPLFGHQMRYNGRIDSNNLPHGYGEWVEDHVYGERLQGYWWHGYPVGPFKSQEIGSGSIFVNNRIAFATDTHSATRPIRYGVASTECSISGYFFKQLPKTYFFNPEVGRAHAQYRKEKERDEYENCDIFYLLQRSFDDVVGSTLEWCVGMLKRQFHLNKPNNQGHMNIYVDKLTNSLKIDGYRVKRPESKSEPPGEITVRLKNRATREERMMSTLNTSRDAIELPIYQNMRQRTFGRARRSAEKPARQTVYQSRISMLIRDEDDWETKRQRVTTRIVADGWTRMRPSSRTGVIPERLVLYIHGYNLTLNELAHIVSFANLPPYVVPFLFNWDGHQWGMFSAFSYGAAMKTCEDPKIVAAFEQVIQDLIKLGIKSIDIMVHSCGAKVFLRVIHHIIEQGWVQRTRRYVTPVLGEEFLVVSPELKRETIRMETIILINPDYPMEQFRNRDYFMLRGFCDHIVMYVNNRDQCLWVSEMYNREKSLGKCIFEMSTSPALLAKVVKTRVNDEPFTIYEGTMSYEAIEPRGRRPGQAPSASAEAARPEPADGEQSGSNASPARIKIESFDLEMDKRDSGGHGFVKMFKPTYSMGKYRRTKNVFWTGRSSLELSDETRSLWLDMDVIDTSMIDTNVDFMKHSFYKMKREIMDDIREVILTRARADQRQSRLDRRRGNVYVFRVAPGNVSTLV